MISREDVLEELELLPVWQSRTPPVKIIGEAKQGVVSEASVKEPIAQSETIMPELKPAIEEQKHLFRLIASEDTEWLFILAQQHNSEAEELLQNMLKAVSVKTKQDIADASVQHLGQYMAKVIVVMGEAEAQQLLNEKQTLAQLRGKAHMYQGRHVVTTYSPSDLLMNLEDKAGAWEDLCLAKFTIANL
jgi:uracil-DNA glycosylase